MSKSILPSLIAASLFFIFTGFHAQDPLKTTQFTLDNGLTVMLTENHNTPQIFGIMAVKAGGKNDPADATGIAHYLEHMLFKGTEQMGTWDFEKEKVHLDRIEKLYEELGKTTDAQARLEIQNKINSESVLAAKYAIPNEMDRMISEIGGTNVNAFTTEDYTAYHNEFPSNKLDEWLQVYDHRFEKPVFRLFQSELETVYEEKNRSFDSPFTPVIESFTKNFWKNHPYGQQTILGHTEHLKNPSLEKMYAYFYKYYVANNMVLVLSGDFDTQEAMALIKKHFSDWRTGEVPLFPTYEEKDFVGNEQIQIKATPIKVCLRGYRTPALNHPDQKKMEIANYLLSNEEESGLFDMLATKGKLSYAAMLPMEYNDYAASVVLVIPKLVGQSFSEAEKLVEQQLDVLRKGDFDEAFFNGAKLSIIKNFERQLESNEERALLLVNAFTSNVSWETYLKNYHSLANLTKADIVATANKYYGKNFMTLYSKRGRVKNEKLSKPKFEAVVPVDGKVSSFCEVWRTTPEKELTARYVDFNKDITTSRLKKYTTLRSVQNPFNKLFALTFSWKMGSDQDSLLFFLPAYLNKLGTNDKTAADFKRALFEVGASMSFGVENNAFNLYVNGIDDKITETLALVQDFLQNYKADQKVILTVAEDTKSERKFSNKDPNALLSALNSYILEGKYAEGVRTLTSKQIKKIDVASFASSFEQVLKHELWIDYTGTIPSNQLQSHLQLITDKHIATLPKVKEIKNKMTFSDQNEVYFLNDKKAVQAQIYVVIKGQPMNLDLMGEVNAYNNYFGNDMSSIMFQEIREFRSLAYSTYARYAMAPEPNWDNRFFAYVGCQGDKTPEALEVLYDLIHNMPLKKERIDGIQSNLIAGAKTNSAGFRFLIGQVDYWKRMGLTEDPNKALVAFYNDLTFDQITAFQEKHIKGKTTQLFIVGNAKNFDQEVLKKYGKVTHVKAKQILKN